MAFWWRCKQAAQWRVSWTQNALACATTFYFALDKHYSFLHDGLKIVFATKKTCKTTSISPIFYIVTAYRIARVYGNIDGIKNMESISSILREEDNLSKEHSGGRLKGEGEKGRRRAKEEKEEIFTCISLTQLEFPLFDPTTRKSPAVPL